MHYTLIKHYHREICINEIYTVQSTRTFILNGKLYRRLVYRTSRRAVFYQLARYNGPYSGNTVLLL